MPSLIKEDHKNDYGCLMVQVAEPMHSKLAEINKKLLSDNVLYNKPDESYGREDDAHCTCMFGFAPDLSDEQIHSIIDGVKPFFITLTDLSMFTNNPEYDVVKFDVTCPILNKLNEKCKKFPFKSDYPDYHPHLTAGYTKKGMVHYNKPDLNIQLLVDRFHYSGINGKDRYFNM